jgi:hypothetical protein
MLADGIGYNAASVFYAIWFAGWDRVRECSQSESRDGYGPGTLVPLDIIVSGTAACGVRGHRPSPSGIS